MSEYPQKEFYKLNEICQYTDTQPYVLRFWESEFPQLNPDRSGSGQPIYRKEDIDLVRRIKQLLYEDELTLDRARKELEAESRPGGKAAPRAAKGVERRKREEPPAAKAARRGPAETPRAANEPTPIVVPARQARLAHESEPDGISRQRYEDAIDEIDHLRLALREAEKLRRKAESSATEAEERAESHRLRALKAGARIEKLLESLS